MGCKAHQELTLGGLEFASLNNSYKAAQSVTAVCCDPALPDIPTPTWKAIVFTEIQGWLRLLVTRQNHNKIIA